MLKETHSRSRGNCISVPFIPSKKRLRVAPYISPRNSSPIRKNTKGATLTDVRNERLYGCGVVG